MSVGGVGVGVAAAGTGGLTQERGLSPGERKALNITSVRARGAEGAGLFITATFAGNIENAIGRGNLKQALVAVVLHPSDASRDVVGVASRRGGSVGDTLTNAGSNRVGVVRSGRKLTFIISAVGLSFSDFRSIEVKAFARFPTSKPRATASATADYWDEVERDIARDEMSIPQSEYIPACRALRFRLGDVEALLKKAKQREEELDRARRDFEKAIPELEQALRLGRYARGATIIVSLVSGALAPFAVLMEATPGAPIGAGALYLYAQTLRQSVALREKNQALRDAIRSLKLDVRLADAYIQKNRELIEKLRQIQGKIEGLISAACKPPTLTPIHAVFTQSTFSTVYTESASGQDLSYGWSVSIPDDPPCANGFRAGVPQANQATWNHADTGEGGTCSHANYDPFSGHPGTVRVEVSNDSWRCVATYFGTLGPGGSPEGDGSAPRECTLK